MVIFVYVLFLCAVLVVGAFWWCFGVFWFICVVCFVLFCFVCLVFVYVGRVAYFVFVCDRFVVFCVFILLCFGVCLLRVVFYACLYGVV